MSAMLMAFAPGRQLLTKAAQAVGANFCRAMSSDSTSPKYTYTPPGSSMREPLYFSTSDPVYFVDPKPDPSQPAAKLERPAPAGEEKAKSSTAQAPPPTPSSIAEPKYVYMPPGSSMREPLYFSTSDPVYFVDPQPDEAAEAAQKQKPTSIPGPTTLKKIDFSSISGKQQDNGQRVSYKMVDEMSQQTYVVSHNTNSMRDPKVISITDPKYAAADEK